MKSRLRAYLSLTKPTIGLLVIITGATALVMEGSMLASPARVVLFLFGLFLTAGSASAFNMYLEREIDAQMTRTAKKRPLANGTLPASHGLVFAISIGVAGVVILGVFFNLLAALLGLGTILFYSFFYTLWLKPRTPLNIVIGGAAGAMGPIIAWAAATGGLAMESWVLFMIIFCWTPPHFWALAYCLKEDYKTVQYPMMPIVRGDTETLRQIFLYTLVTVAFTLSLAFFDVGVLYIAFAVGLGAVFVWLVRELMRTRETRSAWKLFGYSIVYLLFLFVILMIDQAMPYQPWKG
ncbi:MAG: heme o synthase [Candidatus Sumerlaeota bacterium]|nr:heme o synthase [Candidatus Sumerlaeota bacterium]